ncbi:Protein-disulfide isomerase [Aminobacter sp. MSH1]|uniref:Protein-disulfide isomerase n=1 Tax=Aminobacter niigataensis TaxID=83265 RepID=A0ABR6L087_9HYPH|nr:MULTISPECIES: thioredoxin domain-containing protein [Aminobacter]AWC24643.1 Protein-disulfide isomerase [Aminobacter sp. MSH1]MBB4650053.1 protein-disulfide isomerase [Aminobacter niigataensis]
MQNPPPNRRYLLKALAGMGVLAPLPLWAAPLPTVEEVAFDPDIPALGNPDGNVTVVEYTDYQCPYCKLSYIELSKVMAEDGNIRLVLRDWPIFGQVSRNAALLTLASHSQGRYAEAVKTLMTANERLTFRSTANLLSDAGIDVELARNELGARQDIFVSLLTRTEEQAKAFQLKGTPGFLIGKSLYKRGMTADDFRKAIAQARA